MKVYTTKTNKLVLESKFFKILVPKDLMKITYVGINVFRDQGTGFDYFYLDLVDTAHHQRNIQNFSRRCKNTKLAVAVSFFHLHATFLSNEDFAVFLEDPQVKKIEKEILAMKELNKGKKIHEGYEYFIASYKERKVQ